MLGTLVLNAECLGAKGRGPFCTSVLGGGGDPERITKGPQ